MFPASQEVLLSVHVVVSRLICLCSSNQSLWSFYFPSQIFDHNRRVIRMFSDFYECENTFPHCFHQWQATSVLKFVSSFHNPNFLSMKTGPHSLQGALTQTFRLVSNSQIHSTLPGKINIQTVRTWERSCSTSQEKNISYFS